MNLYNRNVIRTPSEGSPIIPPTPQPTISSPTFPHQYFGGRCDYSYMKIEATRRLITLFLSAFYKGKIVREEKMLNLIKLGYYWFRFYLCVHRVLLCLHHSSRISFIFRFYLPLYSPPLLSFFIHFTSEACQGISGSVKRFGSIGSSFHQVFILNLYSCDSSP